MVARLIGHRDSIQASILALCAGARRCGEIVVSTRILVQVAMQAEADGLIERLRLERIDGAFDAALPFEAHGGVIDGSEVAVVTPGVDARFGVDNIGPHAATLLAHCGIEWWRPDLVINAGTAGGFAAHGAEVGDVYLGVPPVVFHDRRIPIAGFDGYGDGSYPCVDGTELARVLGLKVGVVSTGSAIDLLDEDLAAMRASGARVKEMEGAAIAWVCWLHGVDLMLVKSITDLVDGDHPVEEEFVANLALASERLGEAVERVVRRVVAR